MSKKTIWITGGSTGIGKALAIKFANKGWNVAVSARRVEPVSYTHLRAHETCADLVCRLLLEKKKIDT